MQPAQLLKRFRIEDGDRFDLAKHAAGDTCGIDKDAAQDLLASDVKRLAALQERLYAQEEWAILIILQGMDAGGKDGVVAHVMSGVNPQGCDVHSFKAPSHEELAHDFLWRTTLRLPERGRIGIFNRSHYEEVLVVRVHPELLEQQKIPKTLITKHVWRERFQDIRAYERHLVRSGTLVLKFFLHISKEEQRQRFLDRLDEPAKRWKFSMNDVTERRRWDDYMAAYEDMIKATSRPAAPWYVVPADHKWFARLIVAAALIDALDGLKLDVPRVTGQALKGLDKIRKALEAERPSRSARRKSGKSR
jgi:PPK2 family polyphosphate:nucleotide phosphotransferase